MNLGLAPLLPMILVEAENQVLDVMTITVRRRCRRVCLVLPSQLALNRLFARVIDDQQHTFRIRQRLVACE
jgi:hypothetical protein